MSAKSTTLVDHHGEVYLTFVEILARWKNIHPTNARRILKRMGLKPVRLTTKTLLYLIDELVAAEEAARDQLPVLGREAGVAKASAKKPSRKEAA